MSQYGIMLQKPCVAVIWLKKNQNKQNKKQPPKKPQTNKNLGMETVNICSATVNYVDLDVK